MNPEVQVVCDEPAWSRTVNAFRQRDFFHSWTYHSACGREHGGTPWMLVLCDQEAPRFAIPALRRPVEGPASMPDRFDLVSVYGYSGFLRAEDSGWESDLAKAARELAKLGCVSVFSRMHPVLHREVGPSACIVDSGKTIAIDCVEEGRRLESYRKTTRYEIRRLQKLGATVQFDQSDDSFDAFVRIYTQTMKELDAAGMYFFSREWLHSVLEIPGVPAAIGTVHHEGQIVSAGLFTSCGSVGQYLLGGATADSSRLAPQKLLLHAACDWAAAQGAALLHLGGGRGSREDSLYQFKCGFSDQIYPFRTLRLVCDEDIYEQLVKHRAEQLASNSEALIASGWFPAYRVTSS